MEGVHHLRQRAEVAEKECRRLKELVASQQRTIEALSLSQEKQEPEISTIEIARMSGLTDD